MDLVASFLAAYSGNTAKAYARDIADWTTYLGDVDVLKATRADVDSYVRSLETANRSASTIARKLAALSGLYGYALAEGMLERSPVAHVRRPKVSQESQTLGLDQEEARALLAVAREDGARSYALVSLLLHTAVRIGEALALDVTDLKIDGGYRVARVEGKGGKVDLVALGGSAAALDALVAGRTAGPVFAGPSGSAIAQSTAFREVQRLAALAGIADADRVTPHSLRHTSITGALDAGAPLHEVQDFARHADPRMTQRYNRARRNLANSPAHTLSAYFAP